MAKKDKESKKDKKDKKKDKEKDKKDKKKSKDKKSKKKKKSKSGKKDSKERVMLREDASIWQVATGVLAVLVIIVGVYALQGPGTGVQAKDKATVSEEASKAISNKLLQGKAEATLKNLEGTNGVYKGEITVQGQTSEVYITKDGELLFLRAVPLTQGAAGSAQNNQQNRQQGTTPTDVPKADTPKVELFVMSYCPYGTQVEKGVIPVANLLKDKIDFDIKFVNYAMHGKKELKENMRQYCIQKNYEGKYLTYLSEFLKEGSASDALDAVGLTKDDLSSCVEKVDEENKVMELYNDPEKKEWRGKYPPFKLHNEENKKYGVRGSPTLVINGKTVKPGRDAQSLLNAICSGFKKKPSECEKDLSDLGTPSSGFGFGGQGSASAAGCGV